MSLTRSYLLVPALAFTVTAAKAAIINVPGDQPTIQAAIDIAVFGDEVVVAPGIYTEAIDFVGKAITVRSSSGPVATTIRAAGPRDSVVKCVSGEGQTTVLDGFRITGANNNGGPGGLEIFGSSPTIRNCIVAGNLGSAGGMSNEDSSPAVINCIFIDNTGVGGGGMDNRSSDPMVVNCLFIDNTAAFGGGMRNIFSSSPMIVNCAFVGNNAVLDGGGMSNSIGGSPTIFNCTFFGNEAALDGGAMASTTGCHPTLRNGVVWGNIGGGGQIWEGTAGATIVIYSDVEGGFPGTGNINADPLFVDPAAGDLRLLPGSPCIDAANNILVPAGITTDLDGNPRFVDDPDTPDCPQAPGTCGDPPVVDMGAYEFQAQLACPWDCDSGESIDGTVGIVDFLTLLAQWGGPGSCDFDGGGVGITDFLELLANWGPCP